MSEVVQFPGASSGRALNDDTDRRHAEAFRDLEGEVCELERWAELAGGLITECACDRRSWRELELAVLVVQRLSALAGDLRHRYYRGWKDAPEDCA
jgi:hypothetical protein